MKLSKEFSYKNLDGIFSTILLIHGRIMKKTPVRIYKG